MWTLWCVGLAGCLMIRSNPHDLSAHHSVFCCGLGGKGGRCSFCLASQPADCEADSIQGEEQLDKEIPGFLKQFQDGKSYTQGTDRQGRPVTYINVALHKPSEQPQEVRANFAAFLGSYKKLVCRELTERAPIEQALEKFIVMSE